LKGIVLTVVSGNKEASIKHRRFLAKRNEYFWAATLLLPTLLALLILRITPMIAAINSSLYTAFPGGVRPAIFSGLENYRNVFSDPDFIGTIERTFLFNLVINPLQISLSLLISVLMVQRIRLEGLWRTLIFIPVTIPTVGSAITWQAILSPDGPLNAFLVKIGFKPQPFLNSPHQSLPSITLIASWIGIGYWMMFLIAGLRSVPSEIYEAAEIDRAGPIRVFFKITLPLIKRQLLFVLVADIVANFVLFAPIQLLTAGGPESSTTLLIFDAYRTTYGYGSRNLGSTKVVILSIIMICFVIVQFSLLRDKKVKGVK
jgi:multiple sugar transport system permease protein